MRTNSMLLASVGLLAVLVAACTDAPTTLPSADAANVSEARMGTNPPGQVRQIEKLVSAWSTAFAANDASALAALYTEDAEFLDPFGTLFSGQAAIRDFHAFLFSGPYAGSTASLEVQRVVFLTGTIAIVRLNITLSGRADLPGPVSALWVVVKHRGEWQILSHHMTFIQP